MSRRPPSARAVGDRPRARTAMLFDEMLRIRRFEEKCAELYSARQDPRLPASLYRRGGGRRRRDAGADAGRRDRRDLPRARPCAGARHPGRGGHGRDVSARRTAAAAAAAARCTSSTPPPLLRRQRHRRRRAADRRRPGAGRQAAGRTRVTACFFGDGAVAEGEFHESLNLAALWKLPVLFLCENNLYAMGTRSSGTQSQTDLPLKARSYGIAARRGRRDGRARRRGRRAPGGRRGPARRGPVFLELRTYRFRAHSMYDPELYREKAEVEEWKKRDPIAAFRARLRDEGHMLRGRVEALEDAVAAEIDEAVAFAEAGPWEPVEDLLKDVYTPMRRHDDDLSRGDPRGAPRGAAARPARLPDGRGCRPLRRHPTRAAWDCSRSSARSGSATRRCRNRPSSAPASARRWAGMRPIVEIMTVNFSLLALDQIVNNAATLRHMSGGQFSVPLVIRMATGGGRQLAAQHSHSLEGLVCAHPRHQGARAGDARRRARHALDGARGSGPGVHLRACDALPHGRRSWTEGAGRSTSIARRVRRTGQRRHASSPTAARSARRSRRPSSWPRRDRGRGHRPADAAAARHRDDPRLGGEDAPRA